MNDVLEIFHDVNLINSHDGLAEWARANSSGRVKPDKLKPGQFLIFINVKRDAVKVMVGVDELDSRNIVAHYKSPHGRLEMQAIKYIPRAFGAAGFNWNNALRLALEEMLPEKRRKT
jgi:hypothetical protein